MLSRLSLMVQAAVLDGQFLDHSSPFDDGCIAPEVDIGRRDVGEALVVAMVVVMAEVRSHHLCSFPIVLGGRIPLFSSELCTV